MTQLYINLVDGSIDRNNKNKIIQYNVPITEQDTVVNRSLRVTS